MNKSILVVSAILGITAVILGAFAAHGLEKLISPEAVSTFETGVRYQMYYAIILLVIGLSNKISESALKWIFYLSIFGIIMFSGSIYGLATNTLSSFDFKNIGFITPIGGLLLILVWVVLLVQFIKMPKSSEDNF